MSRRGIYATFLTTALSLMVISVLANSAEGPEGVWLVDSNSALKIFDCNSQLCGRVAWLRDVHDFAGQIQRDGKNPDPSLPTALSK